MMKKFIFPIFLLLCVTGSSVLGQNPNVKFNTGKIAHTNRDYANALKAFNIALGDVDNLNEKRRPEAYYLRGLTRIALMREMAGKIAAAGEGADPKTILTEDETKMMETALLDAYSDFKDSKKNDLNGKWKKKVDAQMLQMNAMILQSGVTILNGTFDDQMGPEQKQQAYAEVVKYMDISTEINPGSHLGYDLRGQAYINMKDTANAYESFSMASEKWQATPPSQPDQLIAYVYYRKALIERYHKKDLDAALASIDAGKAALDKEHQRYLKNDNLTPPQIESINSQYQTAKEDLNRFELDILLNVPEKLEQALGKFEKAIQDEPKNYILHVAYAQLLEKVDLVKAEEVYKMATEIDPKKQIAWFNLGALYVNKGVELYKEANEISDDFEKAKAMQKQGDDNYKRAFPFLEKAVEVAPCDRESITAIIQICINLSANDESYNEQYKKYKDMKAECGL